MIPALYRTGKRPRLARPAPKLIPFILELMLSTTVTSLSHIAIRNPPSSGNSKFRVRNSPSSSLIVMFSLARGKSRRPIEPFRT